MDVELRHLRCLVAIADAGSFTDAALALRVSQPAVSRTLAALEHALGVRLLRRTNREVVLTAAGERTLARARRVLAEVEDLAREARTGHGRLRVGHAWAAVGEHTVEFQRRWAARHPDVVLHLVRTNTATGGLAEGLCDLAIVRVPIDSHRFATERWRDSYQRSKGLDKVIEKSQREYNEMLQRRDQAELDERAARHGSPRR